MILGVFVIINKTMQYYIFDHHLTCPGSRSKCGKYIFSGREREASPPMIGRLIISEDLCVCAFVRPLYTIAFCAHYSKLLYWQPTLL